MVYGACVSRHVLIINDAVHVQVLHHKNEEELKATYTAEATVRRTELQLAKSDLLKRIIEQGCTLSDKEVDMIWRR